MILAGLPDSTGRCQACRQVSGVTSPLSRSHGWLSFLNARQPGSRKKHSTRASPVVQVLLKLQLALDLLMSPGGS